MNWKNWAGNVACKPDNYAKVSSVEQVQTLVKKANSEDKKIRVVASGHSFTAVCATDSIMLDISEMSGVVEVHQNEQQITFWAGTNVRTASELCLENGLAMENLGDFDKQTLAGAISTGTHGTGIRLGGMAQQVRAFWVVNGEGELLECSAEKNAEIFEAGRVAVGTFGVIVKVKVQLVEAYKLKCESELVDLVEIADEIQNMLQENRNLEFFYFPMTTKAMRKKLNKTDEPVKDPKIKNYINQKILENYALKAVCDGTAKFKWNAKKINSLMASFVSKDCRINYYNKILATDRHVRFFEMEYNIPATHFKDFFQDYRQMMEAHDFHVYFPVEIRWVQADDIWMSPTYQRDAVYFAVHCYYKEHVPAYFDAVEKLAMKYEGRPHWGKMHNQTPAYLKKVYPKWDDFHAIRKKLDPNQLFVNEYLEKVFGG